MKHSIDRLVASTILALPLTLFSISPVRAQQKTPPPPVVDALGIKLVPQPGIEIPEADRKELQDGVSLLGQKIDELKASLASKPDLLALLPDIQVFHKAVDWALRYDEFFTNKQIDVARQLLKIGQERVTELKSGNPSWLSATGLVVRGYQSAIDGSVQPYGMVIPENWKPSESGARRLDFWAHGRNEKLSDLEFISQRLTDPGQYTPEGAFVLHLYGRYCNANKFAGERDLFEALEHASHFYHFDRNKLVIRGFSMGGAAVWQFGTHFASMWAAVQPGAGFAETRVFNHVYEEGKVPPTPWEETLYRWYDATDYVVNFANTTTVAYSGEIDGQKQAADIMIRYARMEAGDPNPPAAEIGKVNPGDGSPLAAEARVKGTPDEMAFYHVIGPGAPHKILPEAKPQVESLVAEAIKRRNPHPEKVHFVTYTLIYPDMAWVHLEGLEKHWERAEVRAEIKDGKLVASTKNITAIRFSMPTEKATDAPKTVLLDGQSLPANWGNEGVLFHRSGNQWSAGSLPQSNLGLRKTREVCGPIDHAFNESFVFVRPTGKGFHEKTALWTNSELKHAIGFWRKVFRGDAPVKDDGDISDADIARSNLVLWGDPSSNAVLRKILPKLPIQWDAEKLVVAGRKSSASDTMPILIFPNPLNPKKYVVLNSSITFREDALLNNSQQIPKLPDWSVIDINTAPDAKWPGKVLSAGFFDETWSVQK